MHIVSAITFPLRTKDYFKCPLFPYQNTSSVTLLTESELLNEKPLITILMFSMFSTSRTVWYLALLRIQRNHQWLQRKVWYEVWISHLRTFGPSMPFPIICRSVRHTHCDSGPYHQSTSSALPSVLHGRGIIYSVHFLPYQNTLSVILHN